MDQAPSHLGVMWSYGMVGSHSTSLIIISKMHSIVLSQNYFLLEIQHIRVVSNSSFQVQVTTSNRVPL
jgi:hypothetical protein